MWILWFDDPNPRSLPDSSHAHSPCLRSPPLFFCSICFPRLLLSTRAREVRLKQKFTLKLASVLLAVVVAGGINAALKQLCCYRLRLHDCWWARFRNPKTSAVSSKANTADSTKGKRKHGTNPEFSNREQSNTVWHESGTHSSGYFPGTPSVWEKRTWKKRKDLPQPMSQFVIFQTKELLTVLYPFHYTKHRELLWHLHEKWDWRWA